MLPELLLGRLRQLRTATPRPVLLIDGGAGSGKSTLAAEVVDWWPEERIQLLSMDELYPGWNGLAAAARQLPQVIAGASFRRWDWSNQCPGHEAQLDPTLPLVVEGCGALTPASRDLAGLTVWLEVPAQVRRERALARDGELFAPHWEDWAAQEAEHWRRDRPRDLADLRFHTTASTGTESSTAGSLAEWCAGH